MSFSTRRTEIRLCDFIFTTSVISKEKCRRFRVSRIQVYRFFPLECTQKKSRLNAYTAGSMGWLYRPTAYFARNNNNNNTTRKLRFRRR